MDISHNWVIIKNLSFGKLICIIAYDEIGLKLEKNKMEIVDVVVNVVLFEII